jgi:hypothetical protein
MHTDEVYSALMAVIKDFDRKEQVLRVIKSALEAHVTGDNTVDFKSLLELAKSSLTQKTK